MGSAHLSTSWLKRCVVRRHDASSELLRKITGKSAKTECSYADGFCGWHVQLHRPPFLQKGLCCLVVCSGVLFKSAPWERRGAREHGQFDTEWFVELKCFISLRTPWRT